MIRRYRGGGAAFLQLILIGVLCGACSVPWLSVPPKITSLKPSGPAGAWLDPGYARGSGTAWETGDQVCAIDDGVVAHLAFDERAGPELIGTELRSGKDLWRVAGMTDCGADLGDGMIYVVTAEGTGPASDPAQIHRIELGTGADEVFTTSAAPLFELRPVGRDSSTVYLLGVSESDATIFAVDAEGVVRWTAPAASGDSCVLLESHVGCSDPESGYATFDARTGKPSVNRTRWTSAEGQAVWTTGGYTLQPRSIGTADSYTIRDLTGKVLRVTEHASTWWTPGASARVFYPIGALDAARVLAMDAGGRVVLHSDGRRTVVTATGRTLPDPWIVTAVAADGSTFLGYDSDQARSGTILLNAEAKEVARFGEHFADLTIMDGLLVIKNGRRTSIRLPRSP